MKIYLSSTYEDLKDHRRAVYEALRKAGHAVIAMEDYVARDQRPVDKCLADVAKADIYLGLFAFRYGYVPPPEHQNPDGLSITELEFRQAESQPQTRCLTYVLDEKAPWQQSLCDSWTGENASSERIRRLRNELRTEELAPTFSSPHQLASEVLAAVSQEEKGAESGASGDSGPRTQASWDIGTQGSPYPGLLHFTRTYAPVFFGRDAEVEAVLDRLVSPSGHFLLVSGDSGSGKSSLVDAGVLPRLEATGLPGDRPCRCLYLLPSQGNDPFDALLRVLHPYAQAAGHNPVALARDLLASPAQLPEVLKTIARVGMAPEMPVVFLDQMEELFTRNADPEAQAAADAFLSGLYAAALDDSLWVIATLRSDFLHYCHRHPDLLQVLRGAGHYPLGRMEPYMLRDMIVGPAQCAGLHIAPALTKRLIEEAGTEPGNLPLLAFVLQRLFDERDGSELSETVYGGFGGGEAGGMKGALADYATSVERELRRSAGTAAIESLPTLFERLLVVNVEGMPTRNRALARELPPHLHAVVETLVQARLLTKEGAGEDARVSVAHEKLFEAWPALAHWIEENKEALRTLTMARVDAGEWRSHGYDIAYLWHPDRLQRLQGLLEARPQQASDALREFAWPQGRLTTQLERVELTHEERATIGRLLAQFGDPRPGVGLRPDGVLEIVWVEIRGGRVVLEGDAGAATVTGFAIARYPVTNAQFQAFVEAADGYGNAAWWENLQREEPGAPRWSEANAPRETVSWYEAVAFSRWLSERLGYPVRLPTEFEWQQAATGGVASRDYPWVDWAEGRCNSNESGLNRTTAVGLYPQGTWLGGPLDMAGNVWEWCLNKFEDRTDRTIDRSDDWRAVRGGSWGSTSELCRAAYRRDARPVVRGGDGGFRLLRPPSNEH